MLSQVSVCPRGGRGVEIPPWPGRHPPADTPPRADNPHNSSCGKAIFSQVSVCPQGRCVHPPGLAAPPPGQIPRWPSRHLPRQIPPLPKESATAADGTQWNAFLFHNDTTIQLSHFITDRYQMFDGDQTRKPSILCLKVNFFSFFNIVYRELTKTCYCTQQRQTANLHTINVDLILFRYFAESLFA